MTTTDQRTEGPLDQAAIADLVRLAAEQTSRLVREEIALARAELTTKGRRIGTGAGLFGVAGVIGLYGVAALIATTILLLALVLPAWAAALIVTVVLLAVAGIVALVGKGQLAKATPPTPEQTLDSVKADVHTVTEAVRKRGH